MYTNKPQFWDKGGKEVRLYGHNKIRRMSANVGDIPDINKATDGVFHRIIPTKHAGLAFLLSYHILTNISTDI